MTVSTWTLIGLAALTSGVVSTLVTLLLVRRRRRLETVAECAKVAGRVYQALNHGLSTDPRFKDVPARLLDRLARMAGAMSAIATMTHLLGQLPNETTIDALADLTLNSLGDVDEQEPSDTEP